MSSAELSEIEHRFGKILEQAVDDAEPYKPKEADWLKGRWQGCEQADKDQEAQTGVEVAKLKELGSKLTTKPEGFSLHAKIERLLNNKSKMLETGEKIDWSLGEALAIATILVDGLKVRLSGQDAGRGTFSHRHSVWRDQVTGKEYVPLNNLSTNQNDYEVIDSPLSEYAVLGYEYGYSMAHPHQLNIWEAQFGDFANGAQIVIDQYISAAEAKWLRYSGLVMLLPHGMEGMGPEHSSARLERFLQLCAEHNMQVAYPTTPASIFHLLRRQVKLNYRRPLVVMSPKSLLRHPKAVSTIEEFGENSKFRTVIPCEDHGEDTEVNNVVLCSGKVYYDLLLKREQHELKNCAIIRLEQLYPFPKFELLT
ncbi:MAG: 2-oxoglutarate dehydrogenase E1 component, partial [Pseudomonadota bacterium]